jgi:hypothetical protein
MTEAEWMVCEDPTLMLKFLREKASDRKLRLFACACCRRHRNSLRGKKHQLVLQRTEEFADGQISKKEMQKARAKWDTFDYPFPLPGSWQGALSSATRTHTNAWNVASGTATRFVQISRRSATERAAQAALLRDIFGNPFRPISLDPAWLTSTVVALAQGIYAERAFDRMPILADALQDAGCSNEDILNHCRGPGPHCRGCWVVDLILGKS